MATKRRKLKTDDKADYEPLLRVLKGGLAFEVCSGQVISDRQIGSFTVGFAS
jgi:hypothetical protein